ncbi:MAG: hypothetical protein AB1589_05325 [Cyanobacteriota bacterium]
MNPVLQELVINEKYFQEITGVTVDEINELIESKKKQSQFKASRSKVLKFASFFFVFMLISSIILCPIVWIMSNFLGILFEGLKQNLSSALRISAYLSIPLSIWITVNSFSDFKERQKSLIHLRPLFEDFERYNQVIQAIHVKDQLEEVESRVSNKDEREALLQALLIMKQDLIRALKIEKILRENRKIVDLNPEVFESSFTAFQVEKIQNKGNEYSQLISETLNIGVHVRSEMNKMIDSSDQVS